MKIGVNTGLNQLTFTWTPVISDCHTIEYNINASNCGSCPTTTTYTTVTCTDLPMATDPDGNTWCIFVLSVVSCGNINLSPSGQISVLVVDEYSTTFTSSYVNDTVAENSDKGFIVAVAIACLLAILLTFILAVLARQTMFHRKAKVQKEPVPHATTNNKIFEDIDTNENVAYGDTCIHNVMNN